MFTIVNTFVNHSFWIWKLEISDDLKVECGLCWLKTSALRGLKTGLKHLSPILSDYGARTRIHWWATINYGRWTPCGNLAEKLFVYLHLLIYIISVRKSRPWRLKTLQFLSKNYFIDFQYVTKKMIIFWFFFQKMLARKEIWCIFAVPNNEGGKTQRKGFGKFFENLRPA